jgi:dihydroorotate dehydrogenase
LLYLPYRYGFNSEGHEIVYQRVKDLKDNGFKGVIGVNLGKNKISADPIQDYVDGIKLFGPLADYLVVNISR